MPLRQLNEGAGGTGLEVGGGERIGPIADQARIKPMGVVIAALLMQFEMRVRVKLDAALPGASGVDARRNPLGHGARGAPHRRRFTEQVSGFRFQRRDHRPAKIHLGRKPFTVHVFGDRAQVIGRRLGAMMRKAQADIAAGPELDIDHPAAPSTAARTAAVQPTYKASPLSITGRLTRVGLAIRSAAGSASASC